MIRVVLDTNVLVSAFLYPKSRVASILDHAGSRFEWLVSSYLLDEVSSVLARARMQKKYPGRVVAPVRDTYLAMIRSVATVVAVTSRVRGVVRDPKDDPILACAVDGEADYLVTGDRHLLQLKEYEKVQIVTPEEFLQILQRL